LQYKTTLSSAREGGPVLSKKVIFNGICPGSFFKESGHKKKLYMKVAEKRYLKKPES
jgi:hypothetical protein